jgi:hypothetical protein
VGFGGGLRLVQDGDELLAGVGVVDRLAVGVGLLRQPLEAVVLVRDGLPLPVGLRLEQAVGVVGVEFLVPLGEEGLLQPLALVVLVAGDVAVGVGDGGQDVGGVGVGRLAIRRVDRLSQAPDLVVAQLGQLAVRVGDVREDQARGDVPVVVAVGRSEGLPGDRRQGDGQDAAEGVVGVAGRLAVRVENGERPADATSILQVQDLTLTPENRDATPPDPANHIKADPTP